MAPWIDDGKPATANALISQDATANPHDAATVASGCRVKWQHAAFENLKDSIDGLRQPIFASTLGKGAGPEQQLRDCCPGEIECLRDLLVGRCLYRLFVSDLIVSEMTLVSRMIIQSSWAQQPWCPGQTHRFQIGVGERFLRHERVGKRASSADR